jgi:dolichyl-phosphate beta-glucosyltransferase
MTQAVEGKAGAPPGLSIVLPAYNEAQTIAATIAALREELSPLAAPLEFIVVDDGSRDATAAVVQELRAPDVRLLRSSHNAGKGMAVYRGVCAARYEAVCFTDADLPFRSGSYAAVVRRVLAGRPFVVASRRAAESEVYVRMNVLGYAVRRHLAGVLFNQLVRWTMGLPYRDTQCGLKGFQRHVGMEVLARMRSPRYLFDVELLIAARLLNIPVDEVPVSIIYRENNTSLRMSRDSLQVLRGLAGIIWRRWWGSYRHPNAALPAGLGPTDGSEACRSER